MCNVSGPASLQPASIGPGVEGMFPKLQMKEAVMYSRKNEGTLPPLPPTLGGAPSLGAGASEDGVSWTCLSGDLC